MIYIFIMILAVVDLLLLMYILYVKHSFNKFRYESQTIILMLCRELDKLGNTVVNLQSADKLKSDNNDIEEEDSIQ